MSFVAYKLGFLNGSKGIPSSSFIESMVRTASASFLLSISRLRLSTETRPRCNSPFPFKTLEIPPTLALIGLIVRSIVGFLDRLLAESKEDVETPSGRRMTPGAAPAPGVVRARSPVDSEIPECRLNSKYIAVKEYGTYLAQNDS